MCAMDVTELNPLEQKPLEQKPLNENPFEENLSVEMTPSQQIFSTIKERDAQKKKDVLDGKLDEKKDRKIELEDMEESHNYFNKVVANKQAEEIRFGMKSQALNLHAERIVKPALPQMQKVVQEDSKKNLSDRERRKLESRQKSDLKKAKKQGFSKPTGNTLAYKKSMKTANEQVLLKSDEIKEQAVVMKNSDALKFACPSNLFEERYQNKNSPPHDVTNIMMHLETIRETLKIHEGGTNDATSDKRAEYAALKEIADKMDEVMEGILLANGLNRKLENGDYDKASKLQDEGISSLIAGYTAITRNTGLTKAKHAIMLLDEPKNKVYLDKVKEDSKAEIGKEKDKLPLEEKKIWDNLPIDFSSAKEASDYVKTVEKIDQHPVEYKENKEIVDVVLEKYTADCQFLSDVNSKIAQINKLEKENEFSESTCADMRRMLTGYDKEYMMRSQNIKQNNIVLDILLGTEGIAIDYHMYVQREYKITTKELKEYNTQIDIAKDKYVKEKETQDDPKAKEYQEFLNEKPLPGQEEEYISRHLMDHRKRVNNAANDFMLGSHKKHISTAARRTMKGFVKGYNVDEMNQPVTLQDQKNKDEAKEILDAVGSGEKEKIAPIIDKHVKEILAFKIDPKSLQGEQLPSKLVELIEMSDKMVNFENISKENPWYEKELDPTILNMVNEVITKIGTQLGIYLGMHLTNMNINLHTGKFKNSGKESINKEGNQVFIDESLINVNKGIANYESRYRKMPYDVLFMKEVPEDRKSDLVSAKVHAAFAPRNIVKDDFEELYTEITAKKKVEDIDARLVTHFSPKYKINSGGAPLVPAEKEKARVYTEAFASDDKEKMLPHIDKIVKDVMSIKLSENDYEDEYFYSNIEKIAHNLTSFLYIDNIKLDFPWYFEMKKGKDPETEKKMKELGIEKDPNMLEKLSKFHDETDPYRELMAAKFNQIGVDTANGSKVNAKAQEAFFSYYTEENITENKEKIRENNRKNEEASQKIVEDNPKNADGSQKITENNQEKQ